MTYAELITEAIKSSPDLRLTLQQIYVWMVKWVGNQKNQSINRVNFRNVPEFSPNQNGQQGGPTSSSWKNSIRHNLSLHSKFQKIQNEEPGKSSFWCLNINDNQHPVCYYFLFMFWLLLTLLTLFVSFWPLLTLFATARLLCANAKAAQFTTNFVNQQQQFSVLLESVKRTHKQLATRCVLLCRLSYNKSSVVTREGLVSPSTLRSQPQPMQKPTCPPNATVQAEFQTFNVNKLLKNSDLVSFEEELVKAKYPLLASIIIGNTTYREQPQQRTDKTQWSQGMLT